ncbi:ATP F0F1 synthase synthase [Shewanella colwelliana]|uniref:ATP F0F1 synthase synthase n=1 Tax=Shewanella colwelliana TaxID=23 RepID=UPI0022AE6D25|nr:ATP F0F1 synthase synthase [Shewanella colwelliana]MCZ4337877.1 ATP F0F1 synthase synthase [Shewanella colwelliana]
MDHVLVKVKGLRKKPYLKMISDHTLYDPVGIDLGACVPYSPDHNLDEDAWFKIENFKAQPYCLKLLKADFNSVEYDDLTKGAFAKIAFIFAVQEGDFYFQKVTPSLFLKKKMIAFGEAAEVEDNNTRLVVNSLPDAIYFKDNDTLIFRNLATISSIFKGIDALYKEATNDEVEAFLEEDFIELSNGYNMDKVSKPNRKRVALAMDTLAALPEADRGQMYTYIHSYCEGKLEFDADNSTFEIKSDDELKYLLYGIEQRFYTTPLGHEKRLANSVQAM